MSDTNAQTAEQAPDLYLVESDGAWFIDGGWPYPHSRERWKSYTRKSSAQRALKRLLAEREAHYCNTCGCKTPELRAEPYCCIDSVNCLSRRYWPAKYVDETGRTLYRVGTINGIIGLSNSGHFAVQSVDYLLTKDDAGNDVHTETDLNAIRKMKGLDPFPLYHAE